MGGGLGDLQHFFQAQQPLNLQGKTSGLSLRCPQVFPTPNHPWGFSSLCPRLSFLQHRSLASSFHSAPFHPNLLLLQVPSLLRTASYVRVIGCGGRERPLQG